MRLPHPRWYALAAAVLVLALAAAAWRFTDLREWADGKRLAEWVEPYRESWLALPLTIAVFVVLELLLFPVLVLVFVTGLVFGPVLGTFYALAGSVASALVAFFIGRRLGRRRLERWGGAPVRHLEKVLARRGVVAVFLVRKVPAPFTLVNMVCGASPVRVRDFVLGTLLGMGTGIVLITVLGSQLIALLRDPRPAPVAIGVVLLLLPLALALLIQRALNRRMEPRA